MLIELSPCDIRFIQQHINCKFGNGNSVNETIDKICRGEMRVEDLPRIRVVQMNNSYYAFDNRRLYVYRVLHYRGKLDKIKVKLAPIRHFQQGRFSTKNNGTSVRVRKCVTYKHSVPGDETRNSAHRNSDSDTTKSNHLEDLLENLRVKTYKELTDFTAGSVLQDEDDESDSSYEEYSLRFPSNRRPSNRISTRPASMYVSSTRTPKAAYYGDSSSDDEDSSNTAYGAKSAYQYQRPSTTHSTAKTTSAWYRIEAETTSRLNDDDDDSLFRPATLRSSSTAAARVRTTSQLPGSYRSTDWYKNYLKRLEESKKLSAARVKQSHSTNFYHSPSSNSASNRTTATNSKYPSSWLSTTQGSKPSTIGVKPTYASSSTSNRTTATTSRYPSSWSSATQGLKPSTASVKPSYASNLTSNRTTATTSRYPSTILRNSSSSAAQTSKSSSYSGGADGNSSNSSRNYSTLHRSTLDYGCSHASFSTTSSYYRDLYSSRNSSSMLSTKPAAPAPKKSESSCIIL